MDATDWLATGLVTEQVDTFQQDFDKKFGKHVNGTDFL